MSQAIAVISNDWHIHPKNVNIIKDLVHQKVELCNKEKINTVFILGDIFTSRESQTIESLNCFSWSLEQFHKNKIQVYVIPGNHDKTVYSSESSFLDQFKYHPGVTVVTEILEKEFHDKKLTFIPFFAEKEWLSIFEKIEDKSGILLSHIAVEGSMNNGGIEESSPIKPSMFKDYEKVLLGHYHNSHQVGDNIFHLPSICQNNFGEDPNKGFTILYGNGATMFHPSKFKEFQTVIIDLQKTSVEELYTLVDEFSEYDRSVKFQILGNEVKLKSLNKNRIVGKGIKVETKSVEIEDSVRFSENNEMVQYTESNIIDEFAEFCELNDLDFQEGVIFLNKKLKKS